MVSVRLSADYLQTSRCTVAGRSTHYNATRRMTEGIEPTFDHEFAFIAGYTEGGAPFGVRRDETNNCDDELPRDVEPRDETESGGARRPRPTR